MGGDYRLALAQSESRARTECGSRLARVRQFPHLEPKPHQLMAVDGFLTTIVRVDGMRKTSRVGNISSGALTSCSRLMNRWYLCYDEGLALHAESTS
jgi:hypothetical protein